MSEREAIQMPSLEDLDDFEPRRPEPKKTAPAPDARRSIDQVSRFPSREASAEGQLNLKGPRHVLDRFRALCKADRRSYYDMLEILMDHLENGQSAKGKG